MAMTTTYFEATRDFGHATKKTADEQGYTVSVMQAIAGQADPETGLIPLFDEAIEEEEFLGLDAAERAAAWLMGRGCSAHEAVRIVESARVRMMGQSTGTGPTQAERILETPMDEN